jgi:hypothetical protein
MRPISSAIRLFSHNQNMPLCQAFLKGTWNSDEILRQGLLLAPFAAASSVAPALQYLECLNFQFFTRLGIAARYAWRVCAPLYE